MSDTSSSGKSPLGRRVLFGAVLVLYLAAGWLGLVTLSHQLSGSGPAVDEVGTAAVTSCREHGPVSVRGFGYVYECAAEVRWADGKTEHREFPAGEMTPADVGHDVPVYRYDPGRRSATVYGRNDDTARFADVTFPVVGGLVVLLLALPLVLYSAVRKRGSATGSEPYPGTRRRELSRAARKAGEKWPVGPAARAAVPNLRLVRRLRLLACWCVLAIVLVSLSTVPRNDAPRGVRFESPWPQIKQALLADPPTVAVLIFGVIVAVFCLFFVASARGDAARVIEHGPNYLLTDLDGEKPTDERMAANLDRLRSSARSTVVVSALFGIALLGSAAWAIIRAVQHVPSSAPALVWVAALTDAILLGSLGALWLSSIESKYARLKRLLEIHEESSASAGTGSGVAQS